MKIALVGYGKMGKEIEQIALERGHEITLIIDRDNPEDLNPERLKNVDIAIEFTMPTVAYHNFMKCFAGNTPVVSGSTGWLDKMTDIKQACTDGQRFFYASNFSLGVNIFFALNKKLAAMMNPYSEYETEMEEIHHTQKLDSPSGTAITLAEGIIEELSRKNKWEEAENTDTDTIKIEAKRIENVPGTHIVTYDSEIDEIKISHRAKNRKGFALGAVLAAEFLNKQNAGLYSMQDLLGL